MLSVYEVDPLFFWLYWGTLGALLAALIVLTIELRDDLTPPFVGMAFGAILGFAFVACWSWL